MDFVVRRWFALLVLASASFTLFGSLVPFEFQGRSWNDAATAFVQAMTGRVTIESRSDAVANVLLGVPLGFGLLGLLCADRSISTVRAGLYGLAMLPACSAFAASVEFAQLFVPARTCAGSDVLAQTLGSALGMTTWLIAGQRLTDEVRKATTGIGAAGRFLIGYVLLLGFIQALPLDLTLSPATAYRKFRDGGVRFVPFGEFGYYTREQAWDRISSLLKLAGLYSPAGLLAGCLPGRFWSRQNAVHVALAAFGLSGGIECAQIIVVSRVTSATDAIVGGTAALAAWRLSGFSISGAGMAWAIGIPWFLFLAVISWQPLSFPGPAQAFDWIPLNAFDGGNPLSALEEILTKLVLFGLAGALVRRAPRARKGSTIAIAGMVGLLASMVLELGQIWTPNHTPSLTDVMLGGLGASVGGWVTGRVVNGGCSEGEGA
jgi:VanZ family protein